MRFRKQSLEGYLLIDHRAVAAPLSECFGIAAGSAFESATVECSHCGVTVVLNPNRQRPRGYCPKCDSYVCDNPGCNSECKPLQKLLDLTQEQLLKETIKHG